MYQQNSFVDPMFLVNRNKSYVKQFLCSPIVLTLGLLQAAGALLSLFSTFFTVAVGKELIYSLFSLFLPSTEELQMSLESTRMSISLPIVPIACAIGFFLLYSSAKSNKQTNGENPGATILFILSIFSVIGSAFAALLIVVVIVVLFFAIPFLMYKITDPVSNYGDSYSEVVVSQGAITVLLIITAAILLLSIAYSLFYSINYVRFTLSLKKTLSSGYLVAKGAKPFGVANVISSISSCFVLIISLIFFFASLFVSGDAGFGNTYINTKALTIFAAITLGSSIINFIYAICMAKFAFGYNKHILTVSEHLVAPVTVPVPQPSPCTETESQPEAPSSEPLQTNESPVPSEPETESHPVFTDSEPETTETPEPTPTQEAAPKFCPNCGVSLSAGQKFCSNCGEKN